MSALAPVHETRGGQKLNNILLDCQVRGWIDVDSMENNHTQDFNKTVLYHIKLSISGFGQEWKRAKMSNFRNNYRQYLNNFASH